MRAIAISSLALLLAGSCAAGPHFLGPDDAPQSAYGAFLAARYAGAARDLDASARLYSDALSFDPASGYVSQRAFFASLMAGDFDRADRAARSAATDQNAAQLARLYLKAARLAGAPGPAPEGELTRDYGPFGAMVDAMLQDWTDAASGRARRAELAQEQLALPSFGAGHLLVHRALLLEAGGEHAAAEQAYRAADASLDLDDFTTELLGAFLERRGRRDEARRLYERRLARARHAPDPAVEAALARVLDDRRAPRFPDPARAAARSLFAPAALLTAQAPVDYSALYLRVIERLDPYFHRNTMAIAEVLDELELTPEARDVYASLGRGPFAERAAVNAAWLEFRLGERDEALARAERLTRTAQGDEPRLLLADLMRLSGRCAEAAQLYIAVNDGRLANGRALDWRHAYYAGICVQQEQGWYSAAPLFELALATAPEEPRVLNHLGYNLIVIDDDAERGFELVLRAAELAPDNGAILDSLGWGHFKQGRISDAVFWLEEAVVRSPGDPTINWHLGDAYAAAGRDLEAEFQWRRAMELDPSPREAYVLERRLTLGFDAGPVDLE